MSRRIEITNGGKVCTDCKKWKKTDDFGVKKRNPGDLQYSCKECLNSKRRESYLNNPEPSKMQQKIHSERRAKEIREGVLIPPTEKVCRICETLKKASDFERSNQSRDGLNTRCRACYSDYAKVHYRDNKEKYTERSKRNYQENRDYRLEKAKKRRESKRNIGGTNA